ncbi:M20/M25/M40 family metallo-hydrolase [Pontibacillus yanchengensis]|uniref:M20/M25/M40 family metallo-hydrolase n=2 Tax=Pontibacillus yanchengensis TaxID=462910 RepID=A0ACC7VFG2_9BACI|nr:M42 family metallopeptidase [Pontibacillus yanchengensis]MYL33473.1 M20/M25/M40 family metallo-hydrolase [Pontibacillus yanchengensis]MYL53523.1 M20/M25/M40 family metallo-hydrolase [Pontibacillus yanchengensis]
MSNQSAKHITEMLKQLVSIPSPSGYTEDCIRFCQNYFQSKGVHTSITNKGALIATIEGENRTQHRLLTAHVDTLGAMVKEVKSDGSLKLSMIGGFRWNSVEGEYCEIHTATGATYSGTILMHQTSVHVYKNGGDAKRDQENMEVRIDAEVTNAQDVKDLGIQVGDFVSFDPRFQKTDNGFIKSRHLDDKASVAILLELVANVKEQKLSIPYTTHFYISNNEEIGYGGNASIPAETVEYVAVDMGAIGDGQTTTEYVASICAKDATGPYHYGLRQHLVQLAEKEEIDYEIDIYPYYGSDASAAIKAGADVKHALIGPGIDASHAFERTHQKSLDHTYRLLLAYIQSDLI